MFFIPSGSKFYCTIAFWSTTKLYGITVFLALLSTGAWWFLLHKPLARAVAQYADNNQDQEKLITTLSHEIKKITGEIVDFKKTIAHRNNSIINSLESFSRLLAGQQQGLVVEKVVFRQPISKWWGQQIPVELNIQASYFSLIDFLKKLSQGSVHVTEYSIERLSHSRIRCTCVLNINSPA